MVVAEGQDQAPESWETSFDGKVVVIGLGNPYMRDDGIGLKAVARLRTMGLGAGVFFYETQNLDLPLLWQFGKARKIVVLDALRSEQPPGTITVYTIAPNKNRTVSQLPTLHAVQLHDLFDMAVDGGLLSCPVVIVGAEPKDCSVGEGLTEELEAAIQPMIMEALRQINMDVISESAAP